MTIVVTGRANFWLGDQIVGIEVDMLEESYGSGNDRGMGSEALHTFTYTDDMGRTAEWTVSEYPLGVLNNVSFYSDDYKIVDNFHFECIHQPDEDDSYDEDKESAISEMTEWFYLNFQDPANRLPYYSREGGYQYLYGGPYDANEEISSNFSKYPDALIEEAVDRVQTGGLYDWDKTEEPEDYGDDEPPEGMSEAFPSGTTLNAPNQSAGLRWRYKNGQILLDYNTVLPDPITDALHAALREAARDARKRCSTLSNKFPDLWSALCAYVDVIDVEHYEVVEVSAYVTGLDLGSRFQIVREFANTADNEHPELGMSEVAALERIVQLHAPYIQSTPLGSQITELADRENRTPEQTRKLATQIVAATDALLDYPNLVDSDGIKLLRDSVAVPEDDPKLFRRVTLSQVGLRNLSVVIGTLAIVCITPIGAGAAIGALLASATGVASGSAGAMIGIGAGSLVAKRIEPWVRPVVMDTKPFKAVKEAAKNSLDDLYSGDRPKFKAIASMYTKIRDRLRPVVGSPGIDEWFDSLDRDLEISGIGTQNNPGTYSAGGGNRRERPKRKLGYVGYANADWIVDEDGMTAVDGSHDLTISEIFSITKWQKMKAEDSLDVYHILLHFSLKSRVNLNTFVDAWKNTVEAHAVTSSRQIDSQILENTINELISTGRLDTTSQERLRLCFKSWQGNIIPLDKGDDNPF